ncbi:hypothetical protein PHISCL_04100 [Aspergillus sclerotialis]|uniref:RNA helicase HEL117 n=1 Tax=Aspergillus sclerotialis TaxID=2070753 RepID=A0A3A2ZQ14_9EURO|nr:hypothetical protein PHISCL_04100 [Aspergillus sclerotialis]
MDPPRSRSRSPPPDRSRHNHHYRHRDRDRDRHSKRPHSHSHSHSHSPDTRNRDRDRERRKRHHHHHHHDRAHSKPITLPFQARELSKRDLPTYERMFAMYLDIQKGILIEDLSEEEVKGRWKSFVNKWNRGELAEGWYDPSTLAKARRAVADEQAPPPRGITMEKKEGTPATENDNSDEEDDEYGPYLPSRQGLPGQSSGPTIPTMQDLQLRKESAIEDARSAHKESVKQRRAEKHAHLAAKRHLEEEVAPRAEPGTHERRMEKRREVAASNRAFAESRRGGSPTDAAPDDELMGSAENDLEALKQKQAQDQRKKNEREIRREEILRAQAAEREERVQRYRQKEEDTIGWLKTLAKQRFG